MFRLVFSFFIKFKRTFLLKLYIDNFVIYLWHPSKHMLQTLYGNCVRRRRRAATRVLDTHHPQHDTARKLHYDSITARL